MSKRKRRPVTTVRKFLEILNEGMNIKDENGGNPVKILLLDLETNKNNIMSFCERSTGDIAINFQGVGFTSTKPREIIKFLQKYKNGSLKFVGWVDGDGESKTDIAGYVINFFFEE